MKLNERMRGCLLGLAAGDALGTTLEFKRPGSFTPITDMAGGGPFNLLPGQWTDDTAMALCLAESLVERGGFDPADQMRRYLRWFREGYLSANGRCFDVGNTVRAALLRFQATGEPFSGSTDAYSAGNGSLMRLAPVAMFAACPPGDTPQAQRAGWAQGMELCGESSRTTHGAQAAVDACRYYGGLLIGALNGVDKETLLSPLWSPAPGYWEAHPLSPDIREVAAGSFKSRQPPEIRGLGWVVKSLEASLWAFHQAGSYREAVLLAANLGDDADTTAAICGQLAGACWGEAGIPTAWRARLALLETIEILADGLEALATRPAGE